MELDKLTWPEVKRELESGRDTVVVAFGATEQHGPHLPLATDALLGDHLAHLVADHLDAFEAPTVRIGCSRHHLAFPGTISIEDSTFHAIVADVVASLAGAGFRRIVLLPTHGGNFGPLSAALEKLSPLEGVEVAALTDLAALLRIAATGRDDHGVPMSEGGLHAGEWETSMLLAVHPELVRMDERAAGFTGDPQEAITSLFDQGVDAIAENGVIGDPAKASPAHGERYWEVALDAVLERIS
jgi:creatinine amidohydrolase/Fe(II)-dependent formamide hydrolase-like protein